MLTEREQDIVNKSKEWGFGAYLQWAWFEYPDLQSRIGEQRYPSQKRLSNTGKRMGGERIAFDALYLHLLPTREINPLRVEQEAWSLLSPHVSQHVSEFGVYIASYSPQTAEKGPLLAHVNTGWDLLQKWNVISQSYKAKYEQVWDRVEERESALRQLIQQLQQQ